MQFIYTLCFYIALPLILLRLIWRSFKNNPGYRHHIKERFGFLPFKLSSQSIWFHAVSLGESIGAKPLLDALKMAFPETPLLITNTTPTGRAYIEKTYGQDPLIFNAYLPYDTPYFIKRFVNNTHPKALLLMETELWPNLLSITQKQQIPSILVNGRLSKRSFQRYQQYAFFTRAMIQNIHTICAQYDYDRDHFIALGFSPENVFALGSVKFDLTVSPKVYENGLVLRQSIEALEKRPVWVAASTHEGEETIVLNAHQKLLTHFPHLLLILVPRHPERFASMASLCQRYHFNYTFKSHQDGRPLPHHTQVLIGDTMGELLSYYSAADIAFVGGSLIPVGGHNLLEPAALGRPIITGPHIHNFKRIAEMLIQQNACVQANTAEELVTTVSNLLKDSSKREAMGQAGKKWLDINQGATQRHLEVIKKILHAPLKG